MLGLKTAGTGTAILYLLLLVTAGATYSRAGSKVTSSGLPIYDVFTDGIFDLTHYGHYEALQQCRHRAAEHFGVSDEQIHLTVGISGDETERTSYKRRPVFDRHEIARNLASIKWVDEVIYSPLYANPEFLQKHNFDLVIAGDDYAIKHKHHLRGSNPRAWKYYGTAINYYDFTTHPRTPNISTTELIRRTTQRQLDELKKKMGDAGAKADPCIDKVLQLLEDYNSGNGK